MEEHIKSTRFWGKSFLLNAWGKMKLLLKLVLVSME